MTKQEKRKLIALSDSLALVAKNHHEGIITTYDAMNEIDRLFDELQTIKQTRS